MNNYNIKSSFTRKRGDNYNVIIEYYNEDGKLKQKSLGKYSNKKDAEKHLIDLKSSINNNKFIISKNITFVDRYKKYMYDESKKFSPLTVSRMEDVLKTNVTPFFRNTLLQDITPHMLQSFMNNLFLKYAKSTATNRIALVKSVLNEAYRLKEIQENPCNFVKIPTLTKESSRNKVQEPFTKKEAQDFIQKLEGRFFEVHLLLMLLGGLRSEEVCGLKWEDIDFKNGTISIKRVLVYTKSTFYFKDPKTKSSFRTISIPDLLLNKLKKLKMKHNKLKLEGVLNLTGEFEGLVCLKSNLEPMHSQRLYENFSDFCRNNNIRKIRMHDLRHTHATLLVLAGTDFKTISNRLGHEDIKITLNRYSHVLKEMDHKASNDISKTLNL